LATARKIFSQAFKQRSKQLIAYILLDRKPEKWSQPLFQQTSLSDDEFALILRRFFFFSSFSVESSV